MFPSEKWLMVPFIANIVILVPVCWSLLFSGSPDTVFQGRVAESQGLRLLVASIYSAILAASILGLFYPAFFAPVILVQVFYKALWLLIFILPQHRRAEAIPTAIAATFMLIIITYPVFFALALRTGP